MGDNRTRTQETNILYYYRTCIIIAAAASPVIIISWCEGQCNDNNTKVQRIWNKTRQFDGSN